MLFFLIFNLLAYVLAIPIQAQFSDMAPLYSFGDHIKDAYIVVFKEDTTKDQMMAHIDWVTTFISRSPDFHHRIQHLYDILQFKGYSGYFDDRVLEVIRRSNQVAYVERDTMVHTTKHQHNAPWGLARISNRKRLNFRNFNKYYYNPEMTGQDVNVYIIDTGIYVDHSEFEGRATWGVTIPRFEPDTDGNGHGTHCAGIVGGKHFGVAKKVRLIAVKVMRANGSGTMSDVLKGVDWTVRDYLVHRFANKKNKGAVANMSLGGVKSPALDSAINEAVRSGIIFTVAAGNESGDACHKSPSGAEKAITVGASNIQDQRAPFSNAGKCVNLFAPGMNIVSAWNGYPQATMRLSGTSMASPHVAGLAAYLLSKGSKSPDFIKQQILRLATDGSLYLIPDDTPNRLAFNGYPMI